MNQEQSRQILSTTGSRNASNLRPAKKPFVAKGHDAILKGIQDAHGSIIVTTSGDGTEHVGVLIARDKYTITVKKDDGSCKTFYKHAVESFEPMPQVQ